MRTLALPIFGLPCLAAMLAPVPPTADPGRTVTVDAFLLEEMAKAHIPGLAVAIIEDGKIVYAKGYGMANLEHQVPVTPATVFQSGSTGKQYTAMAVLMLMEDGKLSLDDSIRRHLPDAPEAWQGITIRHLLAHVSGLGDYPETTDLRRDYTEEELRRFVYKQRLSFAPGEKFAYSNLGYVTLGFLIGKVSGQSYGDFLKARIFSPLGMTTARVIDEVDLVPHRAAGYVWDKTRWKNQEWVSPTFNSLGDGSLYLTLADVAKWDAALYGEKLVKKTTLAQAWTPFTLKDGKVSHYNCGWRWQEMNGHRVVEHAGAWQGFQAMISRYPDDRLTIAMFANLQGASVERLTHAVAGFWNPALTPPAAQPIADTEPTITALLRSRLLDLAAGKAQPDHYTPTMAQSFFPEKAKQLKGLLGPLGALKTMTLVGRKEEGEFRVYSYQLQWGEWTLKCQVKLAKGDLIAGFGLRPE